MVTHDFAAAGDLEPFGSSLMGLELEFSFRNFSQSILLKIPVSLRAWPPPAVAHWI